MLHTRALTRFIALFLVVSLAVLRSAAAPMATSPPLGMADSFAVLAATAITNVPTSAISGDVGLSPAAGSNYAGLTAVDIVTGTIYAVDTTGPAGSVNDPALLTTAKTDLVAAYNALASQTCNTTYPGSQDLIGLTLVPGVYCADDFTLSGVLTLNGAATDVWVFKSASTLNTSGAANVILPNGGVPCDVWWQVSSSATLGTNTSLAGNILALTSISLATGADLSGRALARNGAVTMDQNTITIPICAVVAASITTQIHDANHVEVTSAPTGTIVHDMATVTGAIGAPAPTGTVSFTVYANQTCAGAGTFAGATPLVAGVADPSDTATLTDAGLSYRAHYNGDTNNNPADGPCEVLAPTPTAVELLYFQANLIGRHQVQLDWATALEVDNFGFYLYRANVNSIDVAHASLPIHFEPAGVQGSNAGAIYVYVDTPPHAGAWWYWLSDIETSGRETVRDMSAKVTVKSNICSPCRVYLPFFSRERALTDSSVSEQ